MQTYNKQNPKYKKIHLFLIRELKSLSAKAYKVRTYTPRLLSIELFPRADAEILR